MAKSLSVGQIGLTSPQGLFSALALAVLLLQVSIEAGVLQRDRCLRRQQFQHCNPIRSEGMRGQGVFEVEQAGQLSLPQQWASEQRSGWPATQIIGLEEEIGARGIIEDHAFPAAQYIAEDSFRRRSPFNGCVT